LKIFQLIRVLRTSGIIASAAIVAVPVVLSSGPAAAERPSKIRSPVEQRESLVTLLSAYERDFSRSVYDSIGPDVPQLLIDIAGRPGEMPKVRTRAVGALANYPNENTRRFLLGLLNARDLPGSAGMLIRAQAIRSLGFAFGDEEVDAIAERRSDPDPQVRAAVAYGLGDSRSKKARLILETWLVHEDSLAVKHAIDRSLKRLRGF